ncbi:hypothetical protein [Desulfomarina sp.]
MLSVSLPEKNNTYESPSHWHDLETLLRKSPGNAEFRLKQSAPVPLPDILTIDRLRSLCRSEKHQDLLERHLLSSALLLTSPSEKLLFLSKSNITGKIFGERFNHPLSTAIWISFPVVVTQGYRSRLLTCFIGLFPKGDRVVFQSSPPIGSNSQKAIITAFQLQNSSGILKNSTLLFWTLQDDNSPPLQGESLGLATGLALHLLKEKKMWPENFYATGTLSEKGRVGPVRDINRKRQVFTMKNSLFIVPAPHHTSDNGLRLIPVENLGEAVLILNLFLSRQNNITYSLCLLAAKDPATLLKQFDQLPDQFFSLFDLSAPLAEIRRNPGKYLGLLATCLRQNSYRLQYPDFLESLPTPDELTKPDTESTLDTIYYCLGQLACWNHLGAPEQSRKWSKIILDFAATHSRKRTISQLANNDFVGQRFNMFDFRPEPPELFSRQLDHEKELHNFLQEDSWQLGAMYGTLAQNYGFCGPDYFESLACATDNGCAAFGKTYKEERKRISSYLIYGLLDRHQWAEAETLLFRYLDFSEEHQVEQWLDIFEETEQNRNQYRFQFCLLCRFLADISESRVFKINQTILSNHIRQTLQKDKHPWQFTATNLARLCLLTKKQQYAQQLLNHAVSICTHHGETMKGLTLLPLSILHLHGLAEKTHLSLARNIVHRIQTRKILNQYHFQALFNCNTGEEILRKTIKYKEKLFPFSYR